RSRRSSACRDRSGQDASLQRRRLPLGRQLQLDRCQPACHACLLRHPGRTETPSPRPAAGDMQRRWTHGRFRQRGPWRLLLDRGFLRPAVQPAGLLRCQPRAAARHARDLREGVADATDREFPLHAAQRDDGLVHADDRHQQLDAPAACRSGAGDRVLQIDVASVDPCRGPVPRGPAAGRQGLGRDRILRRCARPRGAVCLPWQRGDTGRVPIQAARAAQRTSVSPAFPGPLVTRQRAGRERSDAVRRGRVAAEDEFFRAGGDRGPAMTRRHGWSLALALLCACTSPAAWPAAATQLAAGAGKPAVHAYSGGKLVVQPAVIIAAAKAFRDPDPALQAMVRSALLNTGTQIVAAADGTAYVKTGDIPAEWLRDSSVQVEATYLDYAHDPQIRALIKAVIQRQAKYLIVDPYANAFRQDYTVWERKFELDSLCYPILLAWKYYKVTGDASVFTPEVRAAFLRVLDVMQIEQHHRRRSSYRFKSDTQEAGVNPVAWTGMIWTGFRPSDDPCVYNYLIPAEMMAVQALTALKEIAAVYHDPKMEA